MFERHAVLGNHKNPLFTPGHSRKTSRRNAWARLDGYVMCLTGLSQVCSWTGNQQKNESTPNALHDRFRQCDAFDTQLYKNAPMDFASVTVWTGALKSVGMTRWVWAVLQKTFRQAQLYLCAFVYSKRTHVRAVWREHSHADLVPSLVWVWTSEHRW